MITLNNCICVSAKKFKFLNCIGYAGFRVAGIGKITGLDAAG